MNVSRRGFLRFLLVNSVLCHIPSYVYASQSQRIYPMGFYEEPFTVSMNIPHIDGYLGYIDAASQYTIDSMQTQSIEALGSSMGTTYIWYTKDYNGQYYSPVMKAKRGGVIRLVFPNTTPSNPITPYITGLVCEDNDAGFLYSPTANRVAYRIQYSVKNPASTCIYHSMHEGNTGLYAHQGLCGVLCIQDEIEAMLNMRYQLEAGITDIPILIQDKRLNANGEAVYAPSRNDELGGYLGNTLIINGSIYPKLEVAERIYKFRLINGSNARMLYLGFRTEHAPIMHYIISTGKGLLDKIIHTSQIFLAPFERVDVLVDFRGMKGQRVHLVNYPFPSMRATKGYTRNSYTEIEEKGCYCAEFVCAQSYKVNLQDISTTTGEILPSLSSPSRKRTFTLVNAIGKKGVAWRIMTQSNTTKELLLEGGCIEEWEFINPMESIPFCIYIPRFLTYMVRRVNSPSHIQALALTAQGLTATDFGRKDTITIWPGEQVYAKIQLPKVEGTEIVVTIHSKILETFDKGMLLLTRLL